MVSMADVFISYHEKTEGEIAANLAKAMQRGGISCWYAKRDVTTGRDFASDVITQIRNCKVFILLLDEAASQSSHVETELANAFDRRKSIHILPYQTDRTDVKKSSWVRYYLKQVQIRPLPTDLDRVVHEVDRLLQQNAPPITNPDDASNFDIVAGELIKYKGDSTEVIIPKTVRFIKEGAFANQRYLSKVTIPRGVVEIDNGAFSGCSGLTSIAIPDSVTKIGDKLEYGKRIEKGAFEGCSNLKSVTLSQGLRTIGHHAFAGCSSLVNISIPDSVETLGDWAFAECRILSSVYISNSIAIIGVCAFNGCSDLTDIVIPEGVQRIEEGAFWGCSNLTEIAVPGGIRYIGPGAFSDCSALSLVTIPDSVTYIFPNTFQNCEKIHDVTASIEWKEKNWEKLEFLKKYDPNPTGTFFRKYGAAIAVGILWFIASAVIYIQILYNCVDEPLSLKLCLLVPAICFPPVTVGTLHVIIELLS